MAYNITLEGKNKVIAERMLQSVATIFSICNIDYWLEGGTLLGIRRENRLLPWDNDIDVSINHDQVEKLDDFYSCRVSSTKLLERLNLKVLFTKFQR